ncbi:MAG TPA: hypothetical protein VN366_13175 [Feifaniaceae bacterium]|nr:hypothetical protein [Feifaniaceae bacterium]
MMEMPQGLLQALAQDMDAMRRFAQLPGAQRAAIVNRARGAASREEMESIVRGI